MPFSADTGLVAGTMEYFPRSVSTNSIRLPASRPSAALTGAGIVICPFEVTVAVDIINLSYDYIPYITVRDRACQRI